MEGVPICITVIKNKQTKGMDLLEGLGRISPVFPFPVSSTTSSLPPWTLVPANNIAPQPLSAAAAGLSVCCTPL